MSTIHEMARLVLADPNITARQMAEKLGYAEQKSVYYWLEKSGFKGMKDFRKAVLSRTFPISEKIIAPEVLKDSKKALPPVPVYSDAKATQVRAFLYDYFSESLGPKSFAIAVLGDEFQPFARTGDLIIVDPGVSFAQGDLLLAHTKEAARLVRFYSHSGKSPIFVDAQRPDQVLTPDFIAGKVVFIVRKSP